jgi:hypothetical protein
MKGDVQDVVDCFAPRMEPSMGLLGSSDGLLDGSKSKLLRVIGKAMPTRGDCGISELQGMDRFCFRRLDACASIQILNYHCTFGG